MINILLLSNFKTAESRSEVFLEQEQRINIKAIDVKKNHLLEMFFLTFFMWFGIKLDVE
tara:strand:+ start:1263 stop:1439 length:177 start_codon:yes stop_codon:yes gene_type:complete